MVKFPLKLAQIQTSSSLQKHLKQKKKPKQTEIFLYTKTGIDSDCEKKIIAHGQCQWHPVTLKNEESCMKMLNLSENNLPEQQFVFR